jgi:hypothetical protein
MQRKSLKLIALFRLTSLITISASAQRVSAPILPDHAKTPGDVLDVTKAEVLSQKFADYTRCCDNSQFITTTECGQNIFCNRTP